jgi:CRP-like cAMP-binding protein
MQSNDTDKMLEPFQGDEGDRRITSIVLNSNLVRNNEPVAKSLIQAGTLCAFPAMTNILTEGEDGDDIHFILRGKAEIIVGDINVNKRSAVRTDHVGEMAATNPNARRSATVLAVEPSVTLQVSATDFIKIADENPLMWRYLSEELAQRIRDRNEHTKSTRNGPTISTNAPTWKQVVQVLERVPSALERWVWEDTFPSAKRKARKWQIDNEYHVQSLLYFLLKPVFPDLVDEDYLPKVGHVKSRTDLFIPCLRLVVEVKFLRDGDPFSKIEREIAEDATYYHAGDGSDRIIVAFVWDNSCRVQHHDTMKGGVGKMSGINDIVIVSRPGDFERDEPCD